ncbi:putative ankyrin repeat protein [Acanthamoeba polyphaga moumouvirus]|uniref:Putative ankyrin repeat protein n=1 Tax=Acanthamoeba polyphaga moumouvirus TaxID=1269028 RepID=L7RDE0_9VIRU|nr:putative ankyrin repeat protein [Acanthamoeba polyphaga moumouvirus]AGC02311.1 putative ankyrin repeat protein [Acanthamoeba polyphaga moumouvirus]
MYAFFTDEKNFKEKYNFGLNVCNNFSRYSGFNIIKLKDVNNNFIQSSHILVVDLPKDCKYFDVYKSNFILVDKIIIREKYSLFDFETYQILGLDITTNKHLINICSKYNKIDFLEKWITSKYKLSYTCDTMDIASRKGNIDILNWWNNSGLEIKYSDHAIDQASLKGRIDVLNWWLDSGLPLKYSTDSIDQLIKKKHLQVLDWWINSGLELKYTELSMDGDGDRCVNIKILNLWLESTLPLKYSENSLNLANVKKLNWWYNSGLKLKYNEFAFVLLLFVEILIFWIGGLILDLN